MSLLPNFSLLTNPLQSGLKFLCDSYKFESYCLTINRMEDSNELKKGDRN